MIFEILPTGFLRLTQISLVQDPTDEDNEDSSPKPPVSGGPRLGGLPPLGEPRRRKKCCTDVKGTKGIKVEQGVKGIRLGT